MAIAETAKLIASLGLKDQFSPTLKAADNALGKFDAHLTASGNRAFKAGQQIGTGIKNAAKIAVAGIGTIAGLLLLSAKEGQRAQDVQIKFNQAVANSGKVSQAYVQALNAQSTALSNLTGSDDEAITSTQTMLTTMGLTGQQILKITPLILAAATATGRDLESVTLAVGRAVQGSATSLGKIGIIIPKVSKAAKSAALTELEHTKAVLLNNEAQAEAHGALTKSERDLYAHKKAVVDAKISQEKLTESQKTGTKAASGFDTVLGVLSSRYKGVNEALSNQLDTKLKAFNERLQDVRENAGIRLLPVLTRLIDIIGTRVVPAFGKFVDQLLPPAIAGLNQLADFLDSGGATAAIDSFLNTAKAVMPVIQQSAEVTGTVIHAAIDAFRSLPPEIQALAVAGLTINKLTGGLVTNIAGGLISAVISSFRGMMNVNAAVVNVNGAVTPGPGSLGALPEAAGLGLSGLASLVAVAAVPLIPLVAAYFLAGGSEGIAKADLTGRRATAAARGLDPTKVPVNGGRGDPNTNTIANWFAQHNADPSGTAGDPLHADLTQATMESFRGKMADALKTKRVAGADELAAFIKSAKARGFTFDPKAPASTSLASRFAFLNRGEKGSKDVAVANALAAHFETGSSPLYTSDKNLQAAIKVLQHDEKTVGPKSAKAIGLDIERLKTELARRIANQTTKATAASNAVKRAIASAKSQVTLFATTNTTLTVNGRQLDAQTQRYASKTQLDALAGNLRG